MDRVFTAAPRRLGQSVRCPAGDCAAIAERGPAFDIRPRRALPPEECCRGTRPGQAAKSLPHLNCAMSGAKAPTASAVKGPAPGIVCSRRAMSVSAASAFLTLDERPDLLRRNQPGCVARRFHLPGPAVRPAAGLEHDKAGCSDIKRRNCSGVSFLRNLTCPVIDAP